MQIIERRGRPQMFSDLKKDECKTVGEKVCFLRTRTGLTRGGFAEMLGVTRSYIQMVETDKKHLGGPLQKKIAEYCGVPLEWLEGEIKEEL